MAIATWQKILDSLWPAKAWATNAAGRTLSNKNRWLCDILYENDSAHEARDVLKLFSRKTRAVKRPFFKLHLEAAHEASPVSNLKTVLFRF